MKSALCIAFVLGAALTCASVGYAQYDFIESGLNTTIEPLPDTTGNSFDNPNEKLGSVQLIERPSCDTPQLLSKVMQRIQDYTDKMPTASILAKRNKALILSNIQEFESVSAENFTPQDDFNTANALVTIKINKKIKSKEFTLCRQTSAKKQPLYLIIYPYADNYMVHIINLEKYSGKYDTVSLIYP